MVVPEMVAPGGPALNAFLLDWCRQRLGVYGNFRPDAVAIGVANDKNELLSVTAFDNLHKARSGQLLNIECSVASATPRWVTKGTVAAILHYPFCQLKVQRVTTFVAAGNARSLKFTVGLGFKVEGHIRQALENGEDLIVTGMVREEAKRWLGDRI